MLASGLLLAALLARPAAAHDQLLVSSPADGAVLAVPPTEIALTFSADVIPVASAVLVGNAAGDAVPVSGPTVDGPDVVAALPTGLQDGAYTVTWRVVSSDGHPIEGTLSFAVQAGNATGTPTPLHTASPTQTIAPASSTVSPMSSEARLLLAAGAVAALGSAAAVALMLVRRGRTPRPPTEDRR